MNQTLLGQFERVRQIAMIVALVALAVCLLGLFFDSARVIQSYLFGYLYWIGITLGCLGLLIIQFAIRARWGLAIRRLLEAGALTIPLLVALFIPIVLGAGVLYPWAPVGEPAPLLVGQQAQLQIQRNLEYLNTPFFIARAVVYFVVWIALAYALRRLSRRQDTEADPAVVQRLKSLSIFGAVLLGFTVTFAMIDWVMSLEPQWSSTIYAGMVAMGGLLAAFALVIALLTRLRDYEPFAAITSPGLLNDLGNLLLAALLMWAYLAFSQFLVIWTGNLSEEIPWYLRRLDGGWLVVALIIVVLHFIVPFVLLLSPQVKRHARSLGLVAALLVVMHLIETYWLVIPAFPQRGFVLTDIAAPVGIGGLWVAVFVWQLKRSPLLPRYGEADVLRREEVTAHG
jgi:Ni/Fe-hydrogenase subunit HybB-like protein